jgi:putative transposase
LKNRILLENYFLPGDLDRQIAAFIEHYNHRRYHESLDISPRPTSTSDAARPSCCDERGSSERPSNNGACDTAEMPLKMTTEMCQSLR